MATAADVVAAAMGVLRSRVARAWADRRQVQAWCRGGPHPFVAHHMGRADERVRAAVRRVRNLRRDPYRAWRAV